MRNARGGVGQRVKGMRSAAVEVVAEFLALSLSPLLGCAVDALDLLFDSYLHALFDFTAVASMQHQL